MNFIDVLIILFAISALLRGREIGFMRQFCSTVGFLGGLFIGAALQRHTIGLAHTALSRSIVTLITTLGCAFILLTVGEYVGLLLKRKIINNKVNPADDTLGAGIAVVSLLIIVWLSANIFAALPYQSAGRAVDGSAIIRYLDNHLPSAPGVIASLGQLIDPNGFPEVFTGTEPEPDQSIRQPGLEQFATAIDKDSNSVVKIEGEGCGGIVEGSGFVVSRETVLTNAHVVAGIAHIHVEDTAGDHTAVPIWFDPNLDLAVLSVSGLAGSPLQLDTASQSRGTAAAVMGYPGGGDFSAKPAAILSEFTATGRNIYGTGLTARDVYSIKADIIPGNSGGPLINTKGQVIGVVFAESTDYHHVGYALAMAKVSQEVQTAEHQDQVRSTGNCAE